MLNICDKNPSCLVCVENFSHISLPCRCSICACCISQWISAEIQEHFLQGDSTIRCPNSTCQEKCTVSALISNLPHKYHQDLTGLLLRNYIQQSSDIINCKRGKCTYSGIVPDHECYDDLICELCGNKWKEKSQLSTIESFYAGISNIGQIINELQTALYHGFFTLECPKCGIPIRKMGGCNHMTCKKCAHEFCWNCKQDHFQHSESRCQANNFVTFVFISFTLLHIGIMTGTHNFLWNLFTTAMRFILKMCFYNLTFLIIILLVFPFICIWKEIRSDRGDRTKNLVGYSAWFLCMAYVTSWHIPYLVYNHAEEMLWALGTESLLVAFVSGSYFLVNTWLKYVL